MSDTKNILFVGVGGQGIILASKIFTEGLAKFGYDVKMSEVHGMAQRGGSVTTHVRFGKKVYSPIIEKGEADVLVAFEKVEAVRWLEYLKEGGMLIVNDYELYSMPVLIGHENYPEDIIEKLKKEIPNTIAVDAASKAHEIGNIRTQNIVLLGALIKALGFDDLDWESVIKEHSPDKFFEINKKALMGQFSSKPH